MSHFYLKTIAKYVIFFNKSKGWYNKFMNQTPTLLGFQPGYLCF